MPKKLRKSMRLYFSKLKKIRTMSLPNTPNTSSLLSACKYPKTPSFTAPDRHSGPVTSSAKAATLSDVDRFLQKNFQSLYINDDESESEPSTDVIKSSDRFFVSPRSSNSLAEESTSAAAGPAEESVAVVTFSKDPYDDFRRSMQEMVDERHVDAHQPLDWDFMEELLFCYLELNDRAVHKYILRAFADLTVSFRRRFPPGRRKVPGTTRRRKMEEE